MNELSDKTVAVVGLGYVGLPIALAFGRIMETIGFDIDAHRVENYRSGFDAMGEASPAQFEAATRIRFTSDPADLTQADFVIVAVPTPVNEARQPDLNPVINASKTVGRHLKRGAIVVFESTVYPGVTEDVCGPIIERESGFKRGSGFKLGYSPERINPGDKEHTLEHIVKVVSGEDAETLDRVAALYERVVAAGVHRAESIMVAEAAKVIENTQRDLNIALMNELAIIFEKMDLDTAAVLRAAGTKWNFLPFKPGLVGGHCIGVDPYYLTYRAQMLGYHPQVILAGRQINDDMGKYVAEQTVKQMIHTGSPVKNATVLVMGLTFKENCADLRNSRVIDVIHELRSYGANVAVWDPIVEREEARREYGIELTELTELADIDAVVAAVAHDPIRDMDLEMLTRGRHERQIPFMDVKSAFDQERLAAMGFRVWRL